MVLIPHQFIMAIQNPETRAPLDVPQPYRVVTAARHHQPIAVLKAGDAALVPVQCPHELAGVGAPHLRMGNK